MKRDLSFDFSPFSLASWRRHLSVTGALGIALLAVATSGKVFEARESAALFADAANNATVIRLGMLAIASVIIAPLLTVIPMPRSVAFRAFGLFALIALVSAAWSQSMIATAGKAAEMVVGFLVVCLLAGGEKGFERVRSAITLLYYYMSVQVVFVTTLFLLRIEGFYERGAGGVTEALGARSVGPFISANSMGYFSAALVLIVAGLYFSGKIRLRAALVYGAIFAACLICSGSRTSLAFAVVGVLVQWVIRQRPVFSIITAMALGACALFLFEDVMDFFQGNVADSNFVTLSGRTVLWDIAIEAWQRSPFIGFGFGVGSRTAFVTVSTLGFDSKISSVHNGFLEVLLSVGLLGFLPWLVAFCGVIWHIVRFNRRRESSVYTLSVALLIAPTTLMSLGAGGAMSELILLMLLSLVMATMDRAPAPVPSERPKPLQPIHAASG